MKIYLESPNLNMNLFPVQISLLKLFRGHGISQDHWLVQVAIIRNFTVQPLSWTNYQLLQLPVVDAPVPSLISSSIIFNDIKDSLKMEDKRAKMSFRKAHQVVAWAIRAATSASFFNRASLIWLRQLQERISPKEARVHQDINKLVVTTEYSADASLNAAKFASLARASTVTSRRLLWLRHWRVDMKSKWKLSVDPYEGSSIFGAALDLVLDEG